MSSSVPLAPVIDHLPAGIVHVALPTPFPVGPVNCYVLLDDPVTVVDPGMLWADSTELLEAALAFLGVGIPPPTPSWGEMLRTGKEYLHEAPYYAVLPGFVLTLTILSFDTIGRTLAALLEDRHAIDGELKIEQAKA